MSDSAASSSDLHGILDRSIIGTRPLRSPALPDSPTTGNALNISSSSSSASNNPSFLHESRPPSSVSTDFNSPLRPTRSVTPTQNSRRSPVSPTFSDYGISSKNGKRSLKQNSLSSPSNLGLIPPLIFSSLANSSRSSLASDGSSYHSWDGEKDQWLTLSTEDVPQPAWHDLSPSGGSSSATPGGSGDDEWDAEEIVRRQVGLRKSDFMAIQEKLVSAAIVKDIGQEGRERAPSSLRRRRPSTSQSNYSTNGRDHRVRFKISGLMS
jgi:serine/arginine repetitive matrix protein 2